MHRTKAVNGFLLQYSVQKAFAHCLAFDVVCMITFFRSRGRFTLSKEKYATKNFYSMKLGIV